ncbi:MAG: RagB/SusD family nutrient uptake outer membrane protein [Gemmatimonadales bacterium]
MTRNSRIQPTTMRATRMRVRLAVVLLALVVTTACNTGLDLTNPNSPTEQAALSNIDGVVATSLGMQDQFAASTLIYVRAPALVTDEWGTVSKALAADISLYTGDGIDPSYTVVSDPYYVTYRVGRTADAIIAAVPNIPGLSAGFSAGLTANAKLFKAMALGMAAQQYAQLPLDAAVAGGTPVARDQAFAEVIRLLESARSDLQPYSAADLSGFTSRALSSGFDLRNTIDAMLARYYLYTAQYQQALDAAKRVDLSKVSLLTYPDPDLNPIYNYSVVAGYVAPLKSWADQAEPGDQRVSFWVDPAGTPPKGNPPTLALLPFKFYGTRNAPFPVYLPGEVQLIKAEAEARLNDLPSAIADINAVRTKTGTVNTPGAQLPPLTALQLDTQDKVLAQIARERRYELFSQGLRWEDLRRLGQYVGVQPKVTFLPMPQAECNTNPNVTC